MAEKHVHKLRRHAYKTGNTVYFCALPDCSYKINTALALGKRCICWRCGEPFIMNEYAIRLAKPHCEKCHKPKAGNEADIHIRVDEENEVVTILPSKPPQIPPNKPISDLRSRLSSVIAAAQPDDEDI